MNRRTLLRLGQIAVAAALFVVLWHVADGPAAVARLVGANPGWLLAAVLLLTLQTALSALRWRLAAEQLGIVLGRREALREYYMSQIVNQTLPGGFLGDAARAVRARGQAGLLASSQAVMFERLAGQIALFLVLTLGFAATWVWPGGVDWPRWLAMPVALAIVAGLAAPVAFWVLGRWASGVLGRGLTAWGKALFLALAAPRVRLRQAVFSLAGMLCNILAFGLCAWAVEVDLSLTAILSLVPLILFTMLIPLTISGWGLREGAAAALLPLAGTTPDGGLAASIAFGAMFLVAVLPGVAVVCWKNTPRTAQS